jgi:hypothetical protein
VYIDPSLQMGTKKIEFNVEIYLSSFLVILATLKISVAGVALALIRASHRRVDDPLQNLIPTDQLLM